MVHIMQLQNNPWIQAIQYTPGFQVLDNFMCYWFDIYVDTALKMYYWPAFVVGNADDWTALMKMPFKPMCAR